MWNTKSRYLFIIAFALCLSCNNKDTKCLATQNNNYKLILAENEQNNYNYLVELISFKLEMPIETVKKILLEYYKIEQNCVLNEATGKFEFEINHEKFELSDLKLINSIEKETGQNRRDIYLIIDFAKAYYNSKKINSDLDIINSRIEYLELSEEK
jgi:hypothetical protein